MESAIEPKTDPSPPKRHVVIFPFMSKGHTIPLLHLARLLLRRRISVTFFTTSANRPFIADFLSDTSATIVSLPFPEKLPGIPAGVESTDQLPCMSLFHSFARSTELLKPHFDIALRNLLPHVSFIVSDGFLWWTLDSAAKLGVPRFVSYGMPTYSLLLTRLAIRYGLLHGNCNDDDEVEDSITIPPFPRIKIRKKDFDTAPDRSNFDFVTKAAEATSRSFGILVNSFYEMEKDFVDLFNKEYHCKAWCIGPLLLAEPNLSQENHVNHHPWIYQWLDQKSSVLYVAFGTQAEISPQQMKEIAKGLEESKVSFVWVVRKKEQRDIELPDGFEERVRERGIVVREWVEQREILMHEKVKGFLSHCGWNSVLESVCAAVPILAWPMMAEQPLNAKMVVEELKVGIRVEEETNCDGKSFVKWEELKKKVKELMEGEMGREVRKKVKEVAEMARKAVGEGGSSWKTLEKLIEEACKGVDHASNY
ncbi:UDP-glycosyltransferase 90A1 [Morus notabilis]|uniref:Glycosyltransferase n=1 Tax=Morus notabilis TaxID=981085 RepID=W9S8X3_9ROSA|nr:UDP-glycosyltransferase 90A1 [Morus notabilis]EXC31619.1 UDP-glycosyltransferase 90A1 [Morus notabilis]